MVNKSASLPHMQELASVPPKEFSEDLLPALGQSASDLIISGKYTPLLCLHLCTFITLNFILKTCR